MRTGRLARVGLAALALSGASLVACAPETPTPAPTRLALTTQLTWCGGVIPPPGEPWCHTNPSSTTVNLVSGRAVVATLTTDSTGHGTVDVAAGTYRLQVADVPVYMTCESPLVTVVAETTTSATVGCTVMAP